LEDIEDDASRILQAARLRSDTMQQKKLNNWGSHGVTVEYDKSVKSNFHLAIQWKTSLITRSDFS